MPWFLEGFKLALGIGVGSTLVLLSWCTVFVIVVKIIDYRDKRRGT